LKINNTYKQLKFQLLVLLILSTIILKPTVQLFESFSQNSDDIELIEDIDFEDEVFICCNLTFKNPEDDSKEVCVSNHIDSRYIDVYANILIPPPKY